MDNREQVKAVQRMQSFIDSHLQEPITLHMLTDAPYNDQEQPKGFQLTCRPHVTPG